MLCYGSNTWVGIRRKYKITRIKTQVICYTYNDTPSITAISINILSMNNFFLQCSKLYPNFLSRKTQIRNFAVVVAVVVVIVVVLFFMGEFLRKSYGI